MHFTKTIKHILFLCAFLIMPMHGVYADTCTDNLTCCNINGYYWDNNTSNCQTCPNNYPNSATECFLNNFTQTQTCNSTSESSCYKNCTPQIAIAHTNNTAYLHNTNQSNQAYYNTPTAQCEYTLHCTSNANATTSCSFLCSWLPTNGLPNGATATGNWSVTYAPNDQNADANGLVYNYSTCTANKTATTPTSGCNNGKTAESTTTTYKFNGTSWDINTTTPGQKICAGGYYLPSGAQCCQPVGKSHYSANCNTGDRSQCQPFTTTCGTTATAAGDCAKEKVQFKDNRGSFYLHGGNVACPTGNTMVSPDSSAATNWYQNCP